ncbi:AAR2 protein-domain-containing protein [Cladochytrium replicatum]|nr:AAR2 protein-domain-containing protein [Cladochytrium replicatum]
MEHLAEFTATLLLPDLPAGTELTVDAITWTTGERFKGLKFIPPGLHLVCYNSPGVQRREAGGRSGFFHDFQAREIVVKLWDAEAEDMYDDSHDPDQVERYRINVNDFIFGLGPYPLTPSDSLNYMGSSIAGSKVTDLYGLWTSWTSHITPEVVKRVMKTRSSRTTTKLGTDFHFTNFDLRRSFPPGSAPSEVTKYSIDKSWLLEHLITDAWDGSYTVVLGEIQLAFILTIVAFIQEGFERWKALLHLVCECDDAIRSYFDSLYSELFDVVSCQLRDCPEDMFEMDGERSFLEHCFRTLLSRIREHDQTDSAVQETAMRKAQWKAFAERAEHFATVMENRFTGWKLHANFEQPVLTSFRSLDEHDDDDDDDDAPAIVHDDELRDLEKWRSMEVVDLLSDDEGDEKAPLQGAATKTGKEAGNPAASPEGSDNEGVLEDENDKPDDEDYSEYITEY